MHRVIMDTLDVLIIVGGLAAMYAFMRYFTVKSGGRISEEGFGQALGERDMRRRQGRTESPGSR